MSVRAVRGAGWLFVLAAACTDAASSGAEEVAGELRALRLALAAQPARGGDVRPHVGGVQAALQPLRGVLEALSASQRDLAERQVALAQEMQRWSQLLADALTGARADEAKSMAKRLHEIEAQLKSQDARHREVESLLQGALERTADRLDDFLKRLSPAPPNAPAPTPGGGDGKAPPAGAANGGDGERQAAVDGPVRRGHSGSRWWWLALCCAGVSAAVFFSRRTGRPPRAELAAPPVPAAPAEVAPGGQSVEEIWAAAALLGEAVGRLRQNAGTAPAPPAPAAPSGEVRVAQHLEPVAAPPPPTPAVEPARPETIAAVLAGSGDEAAVRAVLGAERLVLRRPAPSVRAGDGGVAVRFHVVPDLPAPERTRLLQRLRDAARGSE